MYQSIISPRYALIHHEKISKKLQKYSQHKLINKAFFNVDFGGWNIEVKKYYDITITYSIHWCNVETSLIDHIHKLYLQWVFHIPQK